MTALDLSQLSMHELFRAEAENQSQVLTASLLALERNPTGANDLEACMRAAHSLKGAARIVDIDAGVTLAHAMEDFFVAAQQGRITLNQEQIDRLLQGVDLMMAIAKAPDSVPGQPLDLFVADLGRLLGNGGTDALALSNAAPDGPPSAMPSGGAEQTVPVRAAEPRENTDRALRVSVDNLNRLLGLAGETLVESRWLKPFGQSLLRLKRLQQESARSIQSLSDAFPHGTLDERAQAALADAKLRVLTCQRFLADRLTELEVSDRQSTNLAHRLYDQALACRMRSFADGIVAFPRMVRDVGRSLGKQVRLDVVGSSTQVDRDILEKLEAPLGHLLRNAIDHGIGTPDERRAAGKAAEGVVRLEATHSAAALHIVVSDDGRGIDLNKLRETVVKRRLANAAIADKLSENELLEFLFLPGFTLKSEVTEISGRGVGLDVVQDMIRQVRGLVRISSQLGTGTRFHLQLPLTLSVVRALLAEIGGEPYAFPLARIVRAVKVAGEKVEMLQGRQHFNFDGQQVGLVAAQQILGGEECAFVGNELPVVVIGEHNNRYGLVVDRFLGGRELVVQPLDPRLGKIKDISAGALMEDGTPVLIVDVEDVLRSMEKLAHSDRLDKANRHASDIEQKTRKRILIVDDSLVVRELERKLLDRHGYEVEVAVDGMDGWNVLRTGDFDLIVTDIDMPRMDGIELVGLIKKDANLKGLPTMIVSYKDREEDRRRGLEAGADYYLSKGSFHEDTLVQAVVDLIGEAAA